jgi:hypothetical protein
MDINLVEGCRRISEYRVKTRKYLLVFLTEVHLQEVVLFLDK